MSQLLLLARTVFLLGNQVRLSLQVGTDKPICGRIEDKFRPLDYKQNFTSSWTWVMCVGPCVDPRLSVSHCGTTYGPPEDGRVAAGYFSPVHHHIPPVPLPTPPTLAPREGTPFPPRTLGHKSGSHLKEAPPFSSNIISRCFWDYHFKVPTGPSQLMSSFASEWCCDKMPSPCQS